MFEASCDYNNRYEDTFCFSQEVCQLVCSWWEHKATEKITSRKNYIKNDNSVKNRIYKLTSCESLSIEVTSESTQVVINGMKVHLVM